MCDEKQQNATVFDEVDEVTDSQLRAINVIVSGGSTVEAAQAANVDRSTVYRWRKDDVRFQAALAAMRHELQDEIGGRLLHVSQKGVDVVVGAIEAGDVRAAIALLKGIGLLGGQPLFRQNDRGVETDSKQPQYCPHCHADINKESEYLIDPTSPAGIFLELANQPIPKRQPKPDGYR